MEKLCRMKMLYTIKMLDRLKISCAMKILCTMNLLCIANFHNLIKKNTHYTTRLDVSANQRAGFL